MSAEMDATDEEVGRIEAASMGPRSDERGNDTTVTADCKGHRLQWGRALMSAEIS